MTVNHFAQLEAARTLPTEGFELTRHAIIEAAASNSIVVVHGPAGVGKTYATEAAVGSLTDTTASVCKFPSRVTQKRLAQQLLKAVTGVDHSKGDAYELIDTLRTHLAEERRLIVIDEAQELSREGIELIRHLWDGHDLGLPRKRLLALAFLEQFGHLIPADRPRKKAA